MKKILVSDAKKTFCSLVDESQTEHIVICQNKLSKPVSVLVSYEFFTNVARYNNEYWIGRADKAEGEGLIGRDDYCKWLEGRYKGKRPKGHVIKLMPSVSVFEFLNKISNTTFEKMLKHIRNNNTDALLDSGYKICTYNDRHIVYKYKNSNTGEDGDFGGLFGDLLCICYISANNGI